VMTATESSFFHSRIAIFPSPFPQGSSQAV
jgi:hypothetical protein